MNIFRKILFLVILFITIIFGQNLLRTKTYAASCCLTGGGPCVETGRGCIPTETNCTLGVAIPNECKIQISPPEQIRITDFGKLFTGAVSFLLLIAFILAFFFLILGGISWLTSGGDKAAVETARNKIIAAIIGLIIVAATWAIFQLVGGAIGYNILGGFTIPRLF